MLEIQTVKTVYDFYNASTVDPTLQTRYDALKAARNNIEDWRSSFNPATAEIPKPKIDMDAFETIGQLQDSPRRSVGQGRGRRWPVR